MKIKLREWQDSFAQFALETKDNIEVNNMIAPADYTIKGQLSVYKNNFFTSLIENLKTYFPVTEKLLGLDCFKDLAREFIKNNPPQKPQLIVYGAQFPDYIKTTSLFSDHPYIYDIALSEWAQIEVFHGAEENSLCINQLNQIPPEDFERIIFAFKDNIRLIPSCFPLYSILKAHEVTPPDFESIPSNLSENVIVFRKNLQLQYERLTQEEYKAILILTKHKPLKVLDEYQCDIQNLLSNLLGWEILKGFKINREK